MEKKGLMLCLLLLAQALGCHPSGHVPDAGEPDAGEVDAGTGPGQDAGDCSQFPPPPTSTDEGITSSFPTVVTAWGANPSDVWAVRSASPLLPGELFQWAGGQWKARPLPGSAEAPTLIAGRSTDDVWFGGNGGVLHHWDGATLTRVESGTPGDILHLQVLADGRAWAVARRQPDMPGGTFSSELLQWDGRGWSVVLQQAPILLVNGYPERGVLATESGDVWFADSKGLFRWHAGALEQLSTELMTGALWASGPNDVWFGVLKSGVKRWNGSALEDVAGTPSWVDAIWGTGPGDVWLFPATYGTTGPRTFFHWDGSQLTAHATEGDPAWEGWPMLSGTGPGDVWAAQRDEILHWDGQVWRLVERGPAYPEVPYALWSVGPDSLWIRNTLDGQVQQWNGHVSTALPETGTARVTRRHLADVWALDPADVWAVGASGTALHRDGSSWSVVPTPTGEDLTSVSGASARDVWAVGNRGVVLHWDGGAWTRIESGTSADLKAVWAGPPGFVIAVGDQGTVLQLREGRWSAFSSAVPELNGVWARAPDDVWVTDTQGTVYHSSGADLSVVARTGDTEDRGVWGMGAEGVFAAGHRKQGEDWVAFLHPELSPYLCHTCITSFHSADVWEDPHQNLWFAGVFNDLLHQYSYYAVTAVKGSCTSTLKLGPVRTHPAQRALHGAGEHDLWTVGDFGRLHHVRY